MKKISFLEAFKDRYLDTGDQLDTNDLKIISKQKYTKNVVVELVGIEKAIDTFKNLRNLQQIVLTNNLINYAINEDDQINQELISNLKSNSSIKSLDISYNQIDSWIEIVKIVELFPYLEELIITGNQFECINLDNLEWQIKVFNNIKNLIAGKLKINWSSIELFNKLFLNLKYLNIFNNNLNDLQLNDKSSFLNLEYLSLSENNIDWLNVLKLEQLNNLKYLQLDNCCIEKIEFDNLFSNLNQLNLNNNQLTKWSSISELSKFSNLTDLSIKDNPLFKDQDYDQMFNFVVGILGELKILNKQIITKDKRKEAEIYFLRTKFRDWLNGKLKEWNIENRFNQLIEFYGKPVDLLNDLQINKFVTINLKYENKVFKKKLLKSMDLTTLKILIRRLFNLDNQIEFDLWYLNDDNKSLKFQFDQDNKNLDFYPLNDNCTIKLEIK